MENCPYCNSPLPQGVQECPNCNASLNQAKPPKNGKTIAIIISIAAVIVIAVIVAAAVFMHKPQTDEPNKNNTSSQASVSSSDTNENDSNEQNSNNEQNASTPSGEQQNTADKSTTQAAEQAEFSVGAVENNVYTNKFANLKFVLPDDNWAFSDLSAIASEVPGAKYDDNTGALVIDAVVEKSYICAIATDSIYGTSAQFIIYKSNPLITKGMSVEEYLEVTVEATVEDMDAVTSEKGTTCKIGNDTYARIDATYNTQNTDISQTFLCKKTGDYYSMIVITSLADEKLTQINEFIAGLKTV